MILFGQFNGLDLAIGRQNGFQVNIFRKSNRVPAFWIALACAQGVYAGGAVGLADLINLQIAGFAFCCQGWIGHAGTFELQNDLGGERIRLCCEGKAQQ
jgi:hypothetical protein